MRADAVAREALIEVLRGERVPVDGRVECGECERIRRWPPTDGGAVHQAGSVKSLADSTPRALATTAPRLASDTSAAWVAASSSSSGVLFQSM